MKPLKFVIPNGSLSERLRMYLTLAGYALDKPDRRGFCGRSRDGMIEIFERDRRTVALHVAGEYDAGITGLDLRINSGKNDLRVITNLCFSRKTDQPTRWVAATTVQRESELQCSVFKRVRLGCELPGLAQYLIDKGSLTLPPDFGKIEKIVKLEGNEEMAVADNLCDVILVVTETGKTLEDLGLRILPGCERLLVSMPEIIAKRELLPEKEAALQEIRFALDAVISAATHVMMKADLPRQAMEGLPLPSEVSPTVSPLAREGWVAVEICIPRADIGRIGLRLERAGGRGIVVQEVIAYATGNTKK